MVSVRRKGRLILDKDYAGDPLDAWTHYQRKSEKFTPSKAPDDLARALDRRDTALRVGSPFRLPPHPLQALETIRSRRANPLKSHEESIVRLA